VFFRIFGIGTLNYIIILHLYYLSLRWLRSAHPSFLQPCFFFSEHLCQVPTGQARALATLIALIRLHLAASTTMTSGSPTLPRELEREIFELCTLSRPVCIPKLMVVAQRVKEWYGTVLVFNAV
jgi:hypothetical protein